MIDGDARTRLHDLLAYVLDDSSEARYCRVGGGALGRPHAGLRPPLKRSVRFSRTPLSPRRPTRETSEAAGSLRPPAGLRRWRQRPDLTNQGW